jgi:hypothetical protein
LVNQMAPTVSNTATKAMNVVFLLCIGVRQSKGLDIA